MTLSAKLGSLWRTHGKYLLMVLVVTAVMLYLWGHLDWTVPPYDKDDGWHYRMIAAAAPGISPVAAAPFRYRLLGTYPIGLLPFDQITTFFVVNYASFVALVVALYFFLVYVGIQRPVAALATILFTFNTHLFGITVWYVFHTNDVISLVLLPIAFWALFERRWGVFGLTMLLGALSRETWVLMPPTAAIYLWERKSLRQDGLKLLAATVPAIIVTLLIRTLLQVDIVGNYEPIKALSRFYVKIFEPEFWVRQFGNSLKPLTFLPLIFLGTTLRFFRGNMYLIAFVPFTFLSSLLGSANERLMAPAFVAFYWLLALIIQDEIWPTPWLVAVIVIASFLSTLHYRMARFALPSRELTIAIGAAAWLVVTVAAVIFKLRTTGWRLWESRPSTP